MSPGEEVFLLSIELNYSQRQYVISVQNCREITLKASAGSTGKKIEAERRTRKLALAADSPIDSRTFSVPWILIWRRKRNRG